jgi:hypothetical protein
MFIHRTLLSMLLAGAAVLLACGTAPAREQDTAVDLGRKIRVLSARVRLLEAEQRQLLVRKALVSSDSKYLELDLARGEGELKYRSRVLRTFPFRVRGKMRELGDQDGVLTVTSKEDGKSVQQKLSFGERKMIIEGRGGHRSSDGKTLSLILGKRDLAALFHALETGSIALVSGPRQKNDRQRSGGHEAQRTEHNTDTLPAGPVPAVSANTEEGSPRDRATAAALP